MQFRNAFLSAHGATDLHPHLRGYKASITDPPDSRIMGRALPLVDDEHYGDRQ